MLDMEHAVELYDKLDPFISDSIWIGKMNHINSRANHRANADRIAAIKDGQTNEKIKVVYEALKDRPKIKWKESVKEVMGLKLADEVGMDI